MSVDSSLASLDLTPDEQTRLSAALQDKQFLTLLGEYAAELSDPENRSRYEEEIRLMEAERGQDVRFLRSTPHHVVKTRVAGRKLFINICSDGQVEKPSSTTGTDKAGTPGTCWRLPYCLTAARPDVDRTGTEITVYDAVFHPDALREAERSTRIMHLLHSTAMEGVGRALGVPVEKRAKRLKGIQYKGVQQPTIIRRAPPEPETSKNRVTAEPEAEHHGENTKPDQEQQLDSELGSQPQSGAKPDPVVELQRLAEPEMEAEPKIPGSGCLWSPKEPRYSVRYRYQSEMEISSRRTRPEAIIVRVELPELESTQHMDIRVEQDLLVLEDQNQIRLHLKLLLPVQEERSSARFNKTNRVLEISLPVMDRTETLTNKDLELVKTEPKERVDDLLSTGTEGAIVNKGPDLEPEAEETKAAVEDLSHARPDLVELEPGNPKPAILEPAEQTSLYLEPKELFQESKDPKWHDPEEGNLNQDLPEQDVLNSASLEPPELEPGDSKPENLQPALPEPSGRDLSHHEQEVDSEPKDPKSAISERHNSEQSNVKQVLLQQAEPKSEFLEPPELEPVKSEPDNPNIGHPEPMEPKEKLQKDPVELEPADPAPEDLKAVLEPAGPKTPEPDAQYPQPDQNSPCLESMQPEPVDPEQPKPALPLPSDQEPTETNSANLKSPDPESKPLPKSDSAYLESAEVELQERTTPELEEKEPPQAHAPSEPATNQPVHSTTEDPEHLLAHRSGLTDPDVLSSTFGVKGTGADLRSSVNVSSAVDLDPNSTASEVIERGPGLQTLSFQNSLWVDLD